MAQFLDLKSKQTIIEPDAETDRALLVPVHKRATCYDACFSDCTHAPTHKKVPRPLHSHFVCYRLNSSNTYCTLFLYLINVWEYKYH